MSQPALKNFTREWRLDVVGVAIFIALTVLGYLLEFEPAMRDRDAMRAGLAELANKRKESETLREQLAETLSRATSYDADLKRERAAIGAIENEMREAAKRFEFERAAQLRDKARALRARLIEG